MDTFLTSRFLSRGLSPASSIAVYRQQIDLDYDRLNHPSARSARLSVCLSVAFLTYNREMVLTRGDELANSFGFQDDNVRNQVEHLMTLLANHRRYANSMPSLTLE